MGLIRLALAGVAGYAFYKYATQKKLAERIAIASGEGGHSGSFTHVRNAGVEAMRDKPAHWDKVDQESDESFPASDPPGNY